MNDEKLRNHGGGDYWHELLERIRDIRSSEKVSGKNIKPCREGLSSHYRRDKSKRK